MIHRQVEQHSPTSLANRLGVTRTAVKGALAAGRLKAKKTRIGEREIYTLETSAVEQFKAEILKKLEARIARVVSDPMRQHEAIASAAASLRDQAKQELAEWTVDRVMDDLGVGREAAAFLLGKYAKRKTGGGWEVSAEALANIKRHVRETRGGGVIRNKGGVFVP